MAGSSLTEAIAQMCVSNVCIPGAYKQLWFDDWFVGSINDMTIERCTGFCAENNFLLASIDGGYILRKFIDKIKNYFYVWFFFLFLSYCCGCGNELVSKSLGAESNCNDKCNGNNAQACGGLFYFSLFYSGNFILCDNEPFIYN